VFQVLMIGVCVRCGRVTVLICSGVTGVGNEVTGVSNFRQSHIRLAS
jgi:hypothetical protein